MSVSLYLELDQIRSSEEEGKKGRHIVDYFQCAIFRVRLRHGVWPLDTIENQLFLTTALYVDYYVSLVKNVQCSDEDKILHFLSFNFR